MGAVEMVRDWRRTVKGVFGGLLHGHLVNALALLSFAVASAGHCHSGRVASAAPARPGGATVASRRRRFERLLANRRLSARAAAAAFAAAVLAAWSGGRPAVLILDETPGGRGGRLCCMRVSIGYRKRAVPLAYACYRPGRHGRPMPSLARGLLARAAAALPPGHGGVTLLADRGLCWPALVDWCAARGWHYVLRMQGATRVRPAGGAERAARDLCPRPGTSWFGTAVGVFKKAGWRTANVVAVWERRCRSGPWLLVTDLPASYARCRGYAKRCWCEQSHRDDKSAAFRWADSRVSDPRHAARLLLVIALATLLALGLGTRVLKRGLRRALDGGRARRTLSLCQLGLRWLRDCIANQRNVELAITLYPP